MYDINKYIEDGEYIINVKKGIIYKGDTHQNEFVTKQLTYTHNTCSGRQHFIKSFYSTSRVIIKNEIKGDFNGSLVLLSNKRRDEQQFGDLKIFDLKNNLILSSYKSVEGYKKKKKDILHFKKYFLLPRVHECNDELLTTTEELIEFRSHNSFHKSDYLSIAKILLNHYCHYYNGEYNINNVQTVKPSCFFEYNNIHPENHKTIEKIRSIIDVSLLQKEIPLCYQHGDLSTSNILYTRTGKIYVIDWEHASYYGFLYDIMWFWQNEAVFRNNYYMYEYFFSGGLDDLMRKIFRCFELKYENKHRLSYVLIMLIEFIKHRVLQKEPTKYNTFLNDKVMLMVDNIIEAQNQATKRIL